MRRNSIVGQGLYILCGAKGSCKDLTAGFHRQAPWNKRLSYQFKVTTGCKWDFSAWEQKNQVLLGFLFTSNKNPLESTSSLTKQQARCRCRSCLFHPPSRTSWSDLLYSSNLVSKYLEGSGKENAPPQGTSPCAASANKLPGETLNWSSVSALQKINTLAKQVKQYPRTNLCFKGGELRAGPRGV